MGGAIVGSVSPVTLRRQEASFLPGKNNPIVGRAAKPDKANPDPL
jgi:hypothetical protein